MDRATFEIGREPPKPEPEPITTIPVDATTAPSPLLVESVREHLERMKREPRR